MQNEKISNNKITVYRIKTSFRGNELEEKVKLFKSFGNNVKIYYEETHPNTPSYLKTFFKLSNDEQNGLYSASTKFLLLVTNVGADKDELAFSFGAGRFLLKNDAIDERFGLKTALNIVDNEEIKNFSKTVLESNPKNTKEQLTKTASLSEFGISIEQDLIKGLTGKIKEKWAAKLGKTVSGSESLTLRLPCDINNIEKISQYIIEAYSSDEYKTNFAWVDQIRFIKDSKQIEYLNAELIEHLSGTENPNFKVWATIPDYIDYEEIYHFKFGSSRNTKTHDDIEKQYIIDALGNNICLKSLKNLKIFAVSSSNDSIILNKWSAFKCLYAEFTNERTIFLLIEGRWYEIEKNFTAEINKIYESMPKKQDYIDYNCNKEAEYNAQLANAVDGECFDGKMVPYGGGYSSIEVCDVQTKDGDLIHSKKYSGSSVLSHLFNQGYVSGELLRNDNAFVVSAKNKIGGDFTRKPGNRKQKIIFAIITTKAEKFDIPFFSKVTLRNIKRRLEGLGYEIEIQLVKNIKDK